MAKVKALCTVRYGSNGFKHEGDIFNLTEERAIELLNKKCVILVEDEKVDITASQRVTKEDKTAKQHKGSL
jgi:phage gp45-like